MVGADELGFVAPDRLHHDEAVVVVPAEVGHVQVVAGALAARTGHLHPAADLDQLLLRRRRSCDMTNISQEPRIASYNSHRCWLAMAYLRLIK